MPVNNPELLRRSEVPDLQPGNLLDLRGLLGLPSVTVMESCVISPDHNRVMFNRGLGCKSAGRRRYEAETTPAKQCRGKKDAAGTTENLPKTIRRQLNSLLPVFTRRRPFWEERPRVQNAALRHLQ